MYFCFSLNIPKLEIFTSFWRFSSFRLFGLMWLCGMLFMTHAKAQTYEAKDEYRNVIFTLTLKPNLTYHIEERYLDGSTWVDSGVWQRTQNRLVLKSSEKTHRKHNYLKFKKAFKFKEDVFEVAGDRLLYGVKGNTKLNAHYQELEIRQIPTPVSPEELATE